MPVAPLIVSQRAKKLFVRLLNRSDEVFQTAFDAFMKDKAGEDVSDILLENMQDATELRREIQLLLREDGYLELEDLINAEEKLELRENNDDT